MQPGYVNLQVYCIVLRSTMTPRGGAKRIAKPNIGHVSVAVLLLSAPRRKVDHKRWKRQPFQSNNAERRQAKVDKFALLSNVPLVFPAALEKLIIGQRVKFTL